jgi:hypothetical protein
MHNSNGLSFRGTENRAIHAVHHNRVTLARERQHDIELRPQGVLPRGLFDELLVHLDVIELAS